MVNKYYDSHSVGKLLNIAYSHIEEGEFSIADDMLESVLNEDPENALAYLYKTLVKYEYVNIEQLCQTETLLQNDRFFRRAVQFADTSLKNDLEKVLSENKKIIQQKMQADEAGKKYLETEELTKKRELELKRDELELERKSIAIQNELTTQEKKKNITSLINKVLISGFALVSAIIYVLLALFFVALIVFSITSGAL